MKPFFGPLALAMATLGVMLTGCVEHRVVYVPTPPPASPPSKVVVYEAPPAPPREVIVAAPGPNYVWAPGYYAWRGRWVWVRGSWVTPPHPYAVWVGGHWSRHGHGYVWVGGHWR